MVASLIVGGVFWLAMVVASIRGAVILPADARIPVHAGSVEHCYLAPKRAGLAIWPGVGALAFGVLGGVSASSLAADWTAGVRVVLAPAALGVLLAFQVGALALARRGVGGAGAGLAGHEGAGLAGHEDAGNEGLAGHGGAGNEGLAGNEDAGQEGLAGHEGAGVAGRGGEGGRERPGRSG